MDPKHLCEDLCVLVWCPTKEHLYCSRVSSSCQVDRITFPRVISQKFLVITSVQWAHEHSGHGGKDAGYSGLSLGSHSLRFLSLLTLLSAHLSGNRQRCWVPWYCPVTNQSTGSRSKVALPFCLEKADIYCSSN